MNQPAGQMEPAIAKIRPPVNTGEGSAANTPGVSEPLGLIGPCEFAASQ